MKNNIEVNEILESTQPEEDVLKYIQDTSVCVEMTFKTTVHVDINSMAGDDQLDELASVVNKRMEDGSSPKEAMEAVVKERFEKILEEHSECWYSLKPLIDIGLDGVQVNFETEVNTEIFD